MASEVTTASVADLLAPIHADLQAMNEVIRRACHSEVELVNQIAEHIIAAGGKRIRPALLLLFAQLLGIDEQRQGDVHSLAAVVEFIHTATLLHDDVVDHSELRRGLPTANAVFGNAGAVLVGDFLYSRAFQMMVAVRQMDVMAILADTTNTIAQGEVLQLVNTQAASITEADYFKTIDYKTAKLFEASAALAGCLANVSTQECELLRAYGSALGMAFQLADDALDYDGQSVDLGKQVGDDLREGKLTLPLIYAQQAANAEQRAFLNTVVAANRAGQPADNDRALAMVIALGGPAATRLRAEQMAQDAVSCVQRLVQGHAAREALPACRSLLLLPAFAAARRH